METHGLTKEEVEKSRAEHGTNALTEAEVESFWSKLKDNFGDPMIKILCVALIINVVFTFLGQTEWYESVGIAIAVIIATFVSTYSEYKNEGAFQKLQEEASQITCKVFRSGNLEEIPINDIVVGDCVLLQSGDKVPADGFVLEGSLSVDQSTLNGESKEAKKIAGVIDPDPDPDPDTIDFLAPSALFRGSIVCSGNAILQVTSVGDNTVYGGIASELQESDERDTPLKVKLTDLAKLISRFGYIGGIAIAVAYLFQAIVIQNGFDVSAIAAYCSNWMTVVNDVVQAVMLAVIIIVMAVPEGLPLMIAIVSSLNMGKMLKDNVLVREINGIETAGSLNILFSDKTGTITKGQLEVVTFLDGRADSYSSFNEIPNSIREKFSQNVSINTEALFAKEGSEEVPVGGNATERALLSYITCANYRDGKAVAEIPFSSEIKYSAAQINDNGACTLIKGAPEIILPHCSVYEDSNGIEREIDSVAVQAAIDELANKAIRVLAFAECAARISDGQIENDSQWTLIGLVGIRDEIRPESISAIKEARSAGIKVVMITGDRKETAVAIAREAGLIRDDSSDCVLTSSDLSKMSDEEVADRIENLKVVARALPSDKSRLVRIAQSKNLVVGMTGDGVNDSTALKRADVGFAMGSGTEVAKEAAEIVILDDNFSSIEKAVLYGRTIFNSIRKFIIFQLTINIAAVLVSFVFPLLDMPNPLSITQILWVNLVMDTLAALALGGEPALRRYMDEKPKSRNEKIVSSYMWSEIIAGSIWTFLLSLFFLLSSTAHDIFREAPNNEYLLTGYFCFFIFISVFNAFNARTERLNLFDNITKNKGFLKILLLIVAVQVAMTYLGGDIFRCYGLNVQEWLFVIGMAFTIIPLDLLRKIFRLSREYKREMYAMRSQIRG